MKKVAFTFLLLFFGGMMAFAQAKVPKTSKRQQPAPHKTTQPAKSDKAKPAGHTKDPLSLSSYSSINGEPVANKKVKPMKPKKDKVVIKRKKTAPAPPKNK